MLRRAVPVRTGRVLYELTKPACAAAAATATGALVAARFDTPLPGLAAGAATVICVFLLLGLALRAEGLTPVRTVTQRLRHVRLR